MLGLGNSLVNSSVSSWAPSDESSLAAWYQYQTGITLNGSNARDGQIIQILMICAVTAVNQPACSGGTLTFDSADISFYKPAGQISLAGDFTIGFRVHLQLYLVLY
jgi:hypothetical protein